MPNPLINILTATTRNAATGTGQGDLPEPQDGNGFLEVLTLIDEVEQVEPNAPEELSAETGELAELADVDPDMPETDPEPSIASLLVGDSPSIAEHGRIALPDPVAFSKPIAPRATSDERGRKDLESGAKTALSEEIDQIVALRDGASTTPLKQRSNIVEIAQHSAFLYRAAEMQKLDVAPRDADFPKPSSPALTAPQPVANGPTIASAVAGALQPLQILASNPVDERDAGGVDAKTDPLGAPKEGPLPSTLRDLPSPISPRPETARAIAGQMAAVITEKPGAGNIQIALNPEELGRVSITMGGREDGLHLLIAAERPETLDLMRRHIAVLADEFQKLGFGDLSFDLGQSGGNAPDADDLPEHPLFDEKTPEDAAEPAPHPIPTGPERGLDLRL